MLKVLDTNFSRKWEVQPDVLPLRQVILLLTLNIADWLFTILLRNHDQEVNPLVIAIVNQSPLISLTFKMTVTLMVCFLLIYAYKRGPKRYAQTGFTVLNFFYCIVVANNFLSILAKDLIF